MTNNDDLALKLKAAATECEQQAPLSLVVYHGKMCLRNAGGIVFSVLRDSAFPEYSVENENYARLAEAANPANILTLLAERDADKAENAQLRQRVSELEQSEHQLICERDDAEDALANMYQAATGERPEWSNWFGFSDAVDAVEQRLAELEARTVSVKLPPLDDDMASILGRPNFTCSHLAELLRKSGESIPRKSEREQAAVIYWLLGLYLEHGEKWEGVAKADIQSRVAGINLEVGDKL